MTPRGIPQGSILVGLLYIIYANDLAAERVKGESVIYIDDDLDLVAGKTPKEEEDNIQLEDNKTSEWL